MRTRVASQLRSSSTFKLSSALALCANATMRVTAASLFWAPLGRIGTVFNVTLKGGDLWAMR